MRLKFFFFTLLLTVLSASVLAAQNTTHKVQDEETLFSIAQKYDVTVKQLKRWNSLSGSAISIGQKLIIKPEEAAEKEGYIVKQNDTLFSIAQKFGVTVVQLKKWNNLEGSKINVGETLAVTPKSKVQTKRESRVTKENLTKESIEPANAPSPVPVVTNSSDGYYTVKSGDTLFRIAQLFGMEVEKLKALNNLKSNNIRVGQELKITKNSSQVIRAAKGTIIRYELKQGMGLKEFLRVFEMSKEEFRQLNPEMKATYINKGQIVQVAVPKVETEPISAASGAKLTVLGRAPVKKYGAFKKGTVTTNGELYNPNALTAAHGTIAIGSVIFVKNPVNKRGIIVRINDRITQKGIKLSKAARQALGIKGDEIQVILYRING